MSPYLRDDEIASRMAAELRRFNFFAQIFAAPGAARIALTQAGFDARDAARIGETAVLYERRRREAFAPSHPLRERVAREARRVKGTAFGGKHAA